LLEKKLEGSFKVKNQGRICMLKRGKREIEILLMRNNETQITERIKH